MNGTMRYTSDRHWRTHIISRDGASYARVEYDGAGAEPTPCHNGTEQDGTSRYGPNIVGRWQRTDDAGETQNGFWFLWKDEPVSI